MPSVWAKTFPDGIVLSQKLHSVRDLVAFAFTVTDCVRELSEGEPRTDVLSASNPSIVPVVREGSDNDPRELIVYGA